MDVVTQKSGGLPDPGGEPEGGNIWDWLCEVFGIGCANVSGSSSSTGTGSF